MPITTDVGLLAKDAVLGPAAAPPRELVVATGVDRIRFLHGLVTGNVAGTEPGRRLPRGALDPQGAGGQRPADLRPPGRCPDRRRRRPGARRSPRRWRATRSWTTSPPRPCRSFRSSRCSARPRLPGWWRPGSTSERSPTRHRWRTPRSAASGSRACASSAPTDSGSAARRADVASLRGRLATSVPELDAAVAEAARIDALEPRFGAEITADYFPMEVGLAGAIDYTKGCYLGQEPIVRVRDRGHINWRLCRPRRRRRRRSPPRRRAHQRRETEGRQGHQRRAPPRWPRRGAGHGARQPARRRHRAHRRRRHRGAHPRRRRLMRSGAWLATRSSSRGHGNPLSGSRTC